MKEVKHDTVIKLKSHSRKRAPVGSAREVSSLAFSGARPIRSEPLQSTPQVFVGCPSSVRREPRRKLNIYVIAIKPFD